MHIANRRDILSKTLEEGKQVSHQMPELTEKYSDQERQGPEAPLNPECLRISHMEPWVIMAGGHLLGLKYKTY